MLYDIQKIGNRIRRLRKDQGMTQAQLAMKLNISDRHLRRIEAGEKGPSIDILIEIATMLDVSLDYIIMGKQSQSDLKQQLWDLVQSLSVLVKEL
ncbi:helix-turn-helix domain-containing protein [uncultured Oscillibacter sp.]|jgi:transcriptional regulator with XRE-family HTH domain|uniref:helix-turn-helix domain-containing protein n=1 Tax=uncultured Oscillibacter sp. TaxID=876091 RepID=UPI002627ACA1|nr:helix-turn-helix transcriptional regulator [uncultured Oscillibacter sp.]